MQSPLAVSAVSLSFCTVSLSTYHNILLMETIPSLRLFQVAGVKIMVFCFLHTYLPYNFHRGQGEKLLKYGLEY